MACCLRAPGEALVFAVGGDETGDVVAEMGAEVAGGGVGVFEHVMQHTGGEERWVGVHAVQDEHGLEGMQDVGTVGAFAALAGVVLGSVENGLIEQAVFWPRRFGPFQAERQRLLARERQQAGERRRCMEARLQGFVVVPVAVAFAEAVDAALWVHEAEGVIVQQKNGFRGHERLREG